METTEKTPNTPPVSGSVASASTVPPPGSVAGAATAPTPVAPAPVKAPVPQPPAPSHAAPVQPPASFMEEQEAKRKAASMTSSPGSHAPLPADTRLVQPPASAFDHVAEIIRRDDGFELVKTPGDDGSHSTRIPLKATSPAGALAEVNDLLELEKDGNDLVGNDGTRWKLVPCA